MGDVSDAMNKARRERGGSDGSGPDSARDSAGTGDIVEGAQPAGEETGALPIEEVTTQARQEPVIGGEEPTLGNEIRVIERAADESILDVSESDLTDGAPAAEAPGQVDTPAPIEGAPVEAAVAEAGAEAVSSIIATSGASDDNSLNGYSPQIVVHHDRGSAMTEQYRAVRTQILARGRNRSLRTHVITSSAPAEGKSVTSVNIGVAFSELRNQKTIMVECDLRRPTFGKLLGRDPTPGLLQLLRGEISDINEAIHPTVYDNLQYIPAGGRDHINSTELLSSPKMTQIMEQLKDRYTHIFFDSPPVVTVTDAAILGAMCDETLLVVRLYKTPVDVVDRAKRLLRANNCEVTGVILTHMKIHMPRYLYRYGYGYGYGYGYTYTYK